MSYTIDDDGRRTGPCAVYGDAIFIARCPHCGMFIQPPDYALVPEDGTPRAKAACWKCGVVDLTFEGWASDYEVEMNNPDDQ